MTYDRDGWKYIKRRLPGIGRVEKSLRTERAGRARQLEEMVLNLCERSRLDLVKAWLDDELRIGRLADAYESGSLADLTRELERSDEGLEAAVESVLTAKKADVAESTHNRYRASFDHFKRLSEAETVREALTTENVRAFKAARREEDAAKETINNDLAAVSVLATHAVDEGWIEPDERPEINKFDSSVRISYLGADEITAYMANLRRPFRPLMQFLIGTGVRLGEAESLRVSDLRLGDDEARAQVRDAKTTEGEGNVFVPGWVVDTLRDHIEAHDRGGADRVFQIPRRTVQKEHERGRKRIGRPDYTVHDHRHTAAVQLAKSGLPLNLLQRQLGHGDISQTMRYARFHPDYGDVAPFFERMGRRLGLTANSRGTSGDTEDSVSRETDDATA